MFHVIYQNMDRRNHGLEMITDSNWKHENRKNMELTGPPLAVNFTSD